MRPFFSIITRTMPGREHLLARCRESVSAQTFQERDDAARVTIEHLIIRDEVGMGVAEAQKLMHTASPRGEYVLVLDDDDYLSAPDVLEKLHAALSVKRPCFAVVKVAHGLLGVLPTAWEQTPAMGHITVSNVVVEHVQWYLHRGNFGAHYAGDFDFVLSLFVDEHSNPKHAPLWVDVNAVTVEIMRNGASGKGETVGALWADAREMVIA